MTDITELEEGVSAVTVDKEVRPDQLAAELGTMDVWISGRRILARVPQARLDSAIAAHVADPLFGAPDEERELGTMETKMRAVRNGTDTFTTAQAQKLLAGLGLIALRARKRS